MAQTNVNIRMDADLKKQFEKFCDDMGMTMTTAINLFVKKAVREYRIPFEIGAPRPSEETACAMAEGSRRVTGSDAAVSATGIAGPGGAVPGKPVGTVWIGVSARRATYARLYHFEGDRVSVRTQTVRQALILLHEEISSE